MEFISREAIVSYANPGVVSRQLLNGDNSASDRLTVTEVHVEPGAVQQRHTHAASEQVWYALRGAGVLLLADGAERPFAAGDVVRFAEGDVHGLRNTGEGAFVYLSVTVPPLDFRAAYREVR